jgi:hypothetical protein
MKPLLILELGAALAAASKREEATKTAIDGGAGTGPDVTTHLTSPLTVSVAADVHGPHHERGFVGART